MNCEECLPSIETGGFFQRCAARRHARRCPQCGAALRRRDMLKEELVKPIDDPPLPPHLRRRWMAVAGNLSTATGEPSAPWARNLQIALFGRTGRATVAGLPLAVSVGFANVRPHTTANPGTGR